MQKRNYQLEMDRITESYQKSGIRPRLLIHSCCAPCSSYVMEYLNKYFDLTMYFYNPNMDSSGEYYHRADELNRLIDSMNEKSDRHIDLVIEDYDPEAFEEMARGHENDPERGSRCHLCYELRLRKTASYMQRFNKEAEASGQSGFDFFATTLTLSPLKDAEVLNIIGEQLAEQYGVRCLASDFKKKNGYKRSIELSKEYSLYRQNYCGCRFSKNAAEERSRAKKEESTES